MTETYTCGVVLTMPNGMHKGQGNTIDEALQSIKLTSLDIKYKGTIKVSKEGKSAERLFRVPVLRRLFANKIAKTHWASTIEKFLK